MDLYINDFDEIQTELILNKMKTLPNEIIIKILEDFEYIYWMKDMVQCDRCGHIWDGYAQCVCLYSDSE